MIVVSVGHNARRNRISGALAFVSCFALLFQGNLAAAADDVVGPQLEEITIVGSEADALTTPGSAIVISAEELQRFQHADVQRILRQVPGVSIQTEDGYGLRPNLSIRGTPTERSGRITLLEDNVLIAPAPYSAPSAYYFPTAGRMHEVEVLKGSASIRQGPYTIGGAMNFLSTPIPTERAGFLNAEAGEDSTSRVHAAYGDSQDRYGWLLETHLWDSDGFQSIDRSGTNTGLDKDDWMLKFRLNSERGNGIYHQLDLKLQYATESSNQSYLGLTDADFGANRLRRYGVSELDNIDTKHTQVIARYAAEFQSGTVLRLTAYQNNHERDWFKTEGLDADGSSSAETFSGASWFNVVQAVNRGEALGSLGAAELQAILDGGDTAPGAVQIRSNAREYTSRGLQLSFERDFSAFGFEQNINFGVRYHEDDEDRLQRNSSYTQIGGQLEIADQGLLGNAGNRLQEAKAWSAFLTTRLDIGRLGLSPGLRYEAIELERTRWEIRPDRTSDPSLRTAASIRDQRSNDAHVLIPGIGALFELTDNVSLYGGVHKGFTAPSNAPGVNEEESTNYEFGIRVARSDWQLDAAIFLTDYDNLLGICTTSSGSDCEIGDAFNGDAASIRGLEMTLSKEFEMAGGLRFPFSFAYTYLDGSFDSDIADTGFFGDVSNGDPLPYIPEQQFQLSAGAEFGKAGAYLNYNYVDEVCVRASCGVFEKTDDQHVVDLVLRYAYSNGLGFYVRVDNLTDDDAILGRQPYGARPGRDRSAVVGLRADF